jgi:DNA-directed DNA polymerase III PolC
MNATILHLDADAFFASVEQAADARLRGRPIAVGGTSRGIVASASYEARAFGVRTPMPTARARQLCPGLIVVPGDYEKYERFSRWMFSYAHDFTPRVEISSVDEGYLDLTGARMTPGHIATTLQRAISQGLKITVSEGLGPNKLISQIASKLRKPCALVRVDSDAIPPFLFPLSPAWLPGVGPTNETRLRSAGFTRIGQLAATPHDLLTPFFGARAREMHDFANGIDPRPVVPEQPAPLSHSRQETFDQDVTDEDFIERVLRRMADDLMARLRADGKAMRTLTLRIRYNDFDEARRSRTLNEPTDLEHDLYGLLRPMLREAWQRRVSLRMVSLKVEKLYDAIIPMELPLYGITRTREARHRLALAVDELRARKGRSVIMKGFELFAQPPPNTPIETGTQHPETRPPSASATSAANAPPPHGAPPAGLDPWAPSADPAFRARLTALESVPAPRSTRTRRVTGNRTPPEHPPSGTRNPRHTDVAAWVPLHVHSHYSFLDSTLAPKHIVEEAVRRQLPAVAITDTGALHGAVAFWQAARAANIHALIGCEVRVDGRTLLLYAENTRGYQTLCRLLTQGREFFRTSPELPPTPTTIPAGRFGRIDTGMAPPFHDTAGLIAIADDPTLAPFFPGAFYLGAASGKHALRWALAGFPVVAAPGIHHATPADSTAYRIVQSIRTLTLLDQPHPEKKQCGAFHFPSSEEMARRFAACPEALARTREIAERCSFQFDTGRLHFPAYRPEDGSEARAFLAHLVHEGARQRYGSRFNTVTPQLTTELELIHEVGYEEYFLTVWDLLQRCRERGIDWITRGSAADSLVCYCLGISDVCPVRFDLYFRRFLNRERMVMNKLPDIDVDFPHDRKDDVVDLAFARFGVEHTAVVGGFSTFQSRSAFAEIGKVLGVSEYHIRRVTEKLPRVRASEIADYAREAIESTDLPLSEEPYATALATAHLLDGVPRHAKMHPCGIVLSRAPIADLAPRFMTPKGWPATHYDMDAVEDIGLVKIDLLAQGGLAAMRDTFALLDASPARAAEAPTRYGSRAVRRAPPPRSYAELHRLEPWDDQEVWDLISTGQARGVHHIESPAMISLAKQLNVRDIDTLIAMVSVIRPGAANEQKKTRFALRHQGMEPVDYPHPSLERCLRGTYGLVVYEEQILQICEDFAGLDAGRADRLRRALVKRDLETAIAIGRDFAECAAARGRSIEESRHVWELVCGFNGYAFCKAHSTAYGVEAYQAAWLKRYHPAEFMASVLTNGKGFYSPLVYVLECHRMGIPLHPPCVNMPGPGYLPHLGGIRTPVSAIKGLSAAFLQRLHAHAPFPSLRAFFEHTDPDTSEATALLNAGALDVFSTSRTNLFWELAALHRSSSPTGTLVPPDPIHHPDIELSEPDPMQRLQWEMDLLGFSVSDHPTALHAHIDWDSYCPIQNLPLFMGREVVCCGWVVESRTAHQVTGEKMKFMTLADRTGMVETELFATGYRRYGLTSVRYPVLEACAVVVPYPNRRGFSLRITRLSAPRQSPARP